MYSEEKAKSTGPFHPANKLAIVLVTRSGSLKILYQVPDGKWSEVTTELKNLSSSDEVLTHAVISSMPGTLGFCVNESRRAKTSTRQ